MKETIILWDSLCAETWLCEVIKTFPDNVNNPLGLFSVMDISDELLIH